MLRKLNPNAQAFALSLTPKTAYARTDVGLSTLASVYGQECVHTLICAWLFELCEFLRGKEEAKLSEGQLRQTAALLYSEAYYLNVAEFSLFFVRMKKGAYGKFFGAVDGQSILIMLSEYLGDRRRALEALKREQEEEQRRLWHESIRTIGVAAKMASDELKKKEEEERKKAEEEAKSKANVEL